MAACKESVKLYVYDMTKGLAKSFSPFVLGKQVEGIWHTSIVVFGQEYFFGSGGIDSCLPCGTVLGQPDKVIDLGKTGIPFSLFMEYLCTLGESKFRPELYDLFNHNCNNFSQEVANFLTGKSIPQEILDLPNEVLTTPLGNTFRSYMNNFDVRTKHSTFKSNRTSPRNNKSENWPNTSSTNDSPQYSAAESAKTAQSQSRSSLKSDDKKYQPDIVSELKIYNDVNISEAVKELVELLPLDAAAEKESLNLCLEMFSSDKTSISEKKFLELIVCRRLFTLRFHHERSIFAIAVIKGERLLKLAKNPNGLFCQLQQPRLTPLALQKLCLREVRTSQIWKFLESCMLLNTEKFGCNVHKLTLQILRAMLLSKKITIITEDSNNFIMKYCICLESFDIDVQKEILKLFCSFCSQDSTICWFLSESEWKANGKIHSNCQVSVYITVHCLLSDFPGLKVLAVDLLSNLSIKGRLGSDAVTELATALLQFLHDDLTDEIAYKCLSAFYRFLCTPACNDILALTHVLGPNFQKFSNSSERNKRIVKCIQEKLTLL